MLNFPCYHSGSGTHDVWHGPSNENEAPASGNVQLSHGVRHPLQEGHPHQLAEFITVPGAKLWHGALSAESRVARAPFVLLEQSAGRATPPERCTQAVWQECSNRTVWSTAANGTHAIEVERVFNSSEPIVGEVSGGTGASLQSDAQLKLRTRKVEELRQENLQWAAWYSYHKGVIWDMEVERSTQSKALREQELELAVLARSVDQGGSLNAELRTQIQSQQLLLDEATNGAARLYPQSVAVVDDVEAAATPRGFRGQTVQEEADSRSEIAETLAEAAAASRETNAKEVAALRSLCYSRGEEVARQAACLDQQFTSMEEVRQCLAESQLRGRALELQVFEVQGLLDEERNSAKRLVSMEGDELQLRLNEKERNWDELQRECVEYRKRIHGMEAREIRSREELEQCRAVEGALKELAQRDAASSDVRVFELSASLASTQGQMREEHEENLKLQASLDQARCQLHARAIDDVRGAPNADAKLSAAMAAERAEVGTEIALISSELYAFKEEAAKAEARVKLVEAAAEDASTKMAASNRAMGAEKSRFGAEMAEAQARAAICETAALHADENAKLADAELKATSTANVRLQKQLIELGELRHATCEERDALRVELASTKEVFERLSASELRASAFEDAATTAAATIESLLAAKAAEDERVESVRVVAAAEGDKIGKLMMQAHDTLRKELDEVRATGESAIKVREAFTGELTQMRASGDELRNSLNQSESSVRSLEAALAEEADIMRAQIALQYELAEARTEKVRVDTELAAAVAEAVASEAAASEAHERAVAAEEDAKQMIVARDTSKEMLLELQMNSRVIYAEAAEEGVLARAEASASYQTELGAREALKKDLAESRALSEELGQRLLESALRIGAFEDASAESAIAMARLTTENAALAAEFAAAQADAAAKEAASASAARDAQDSLRTELGDAQASIQAAKTAQDTLQEQLVEMQEHCQLREVAITDQTARLDEQFALLEVLRKSSRECEVKTNASELLLARAGNEVEEVRAEALEHARRIAEQHAVTLDSAEKAGAEALRQLMLRVDDENSKRTRHAQREAALEAELTDARVKAQEQACELLEARGAAVARVTELGNELECFKVAMRDAESKRLEADMKTKEVHAEVKCLRDEADLNRQVVSECEDLRSHARELSQTLSLLKQQVETLEVENKTLRESLALFEEDLERVSGQHAELLGHTNLKQKIRYVLKLKDQKNQLRADLEKMRTRVTQLESCRRSETLFDALASLGYANLHDRRDACSPGRTSGLPPPRTPSRSSASVTTPGIVARTPRRERSATARCGVSMLAEAVEDQSAPLLLLRAEGAERKSRMQERMLERIQADFGHLMLLVERALSRERPNSPQQPIASRTIGESDDVANKFGTSPSHAETNFASLLRRLRDMCCADASSGDRLPFMPRRGSQRFPLGSCVCAGMGSQRRGSIGVFKGGCVDETVAVNALSSPANAATDSIFAACGLENTISVNSDGMVGSLADVL